MESVSRNELISKWFIFAFGTIAVPIYFIFGTFDLHIIADSGYELASDNFILANLVYFTIWSNILAYIWSVLALLSIYGGLEKLYNFCEHPSIKSVPFIMMGITCIVSFIILYPLGYIYLLGEYTFIKATWIIFYVAFLTWLLFQHLMVWVVMVLDMVFTGGYRAKNDEKENGKTIIINCAYSTIVPLIWLVLSLFLIGFGVIPPQYPFMDIFNQGPILTFINIIILVLIFVSWFISFWGLSVWSNKKYM